jgi:LysM repeat protein
MEQKPHRYIFLVILTLAISLFPANTSVRAQPQSVNAYDLINAVNNLRASRGLPAYSVNSILMGIAQSHSEYQAAIGSWTHYGLGGSDERDRALAAGYPVGAIDENVWMGQNLTAEQVVSNWSGDAPHLNNMISSVYIEAGAGLACSGNYCFFTLDVAQPSGAPVSYAPAAGATNIPGGAAVATIAVVFPSTLEPDGSLKHTVREGEVLYTISVAYKVSVDEIKKLNKLSSDIIYPGDVLVIRLASGTLTPTVAASFTPAPTYTPFVFWTVTSSPSPAPTPVPSAPVREGSGAMVVAIIIVAALVLSGVLTAAGMRKRS